MVVEVEVNAINIEFIHELLTQFPLKHTQQPNVGTLKLLGNPIKMSTTCPHPRGPAPALGEHTEQVLQDVLHMSAEAISLSRAKGAFD